MPADDESEREEYFERLSEEQPFLDRYLGRPHPAATRPGRRARDAADGLPTARVAAILLGLIGLVYVVIWMSMSDAGSLQRLWTGVGLVTSLLVPVVLILAVAKVWRRRRR